MRFAKAKRTLQERKGTVLLQQKGSPFSSELGRRGGAMVANGVLAIGTHDGMLQLIDAETGALRMDVQAHQQSVQCVALSPAGDLLATASFDRSWKLWDVSTGAELRWVRGHDREGTCICEMGLFGRCCRSVRECCPVVGHSRSLSSITFSPSGTKVATGGADACVMVWDARAGTREQFMPGHAGSVVSVSFAADGERLASAGLEGSIRVWDPRSGEAILTIHHPLQGGIKSVAYTHQDQYLVSGGDRGRVDLWDGTTGLHLREFLGHSGMVHAVAVSAVCGRVVSAGDDLSVRIWDVTGHDKAVGYGKAVGLGKGVATSLVLPGHDGIGDEEMPCICDADAEDAELRRDNCPCPGHREAVQSLALSHDGRTVASGGKDTSWRLWDVDTRALLQSSSASAHVNSVALGRDFVRERRFAAFAMGQLQRLGAGSPVRGLHPEVVRMVLEEEHGGGGM